MNAIRESDIALRRRAKAAAAAVLSILFSAMIVFGTPQAPQQPAETPAGPPPALSMAEAPVPDPVIEQAGTHPLDETPWQWDR